ncbi:PREDICTED: putative cyclin-B3-1 isoform X3 [Ipomoea nil]|uniref:putative cyclin-B3-1 isoform X3 n=1 Tax=Ipomoea nil TaxID=35883 RepID=UPI000901A4B5|nr:PREDICTED: putative cyclin-B3-1 isoform X3 [Ipomoea nil]
MVVVKGKSNAVANLLAQDRKPSKNKIEKTEVGGRISLSTDSKKSAMLNSTAMQSRATSLKRYMEKNKSKHGSAVKVKVGRKVLSDISNTKSSSSVKVKVGRKVLADISNTRGSFSRTELHEGSKQGKDNGKKLSYLQRSSVCTGTSATNMSLRKPLKKAKMRVSLAEASGDHHILMKVSKELKAAGDDPRAKARGSVVATIGNRTSEKNLLLPSRKSLPVLKQANVVDTINTKKENAKCSEKGIGKQGFSVSAKPKIGRKILSQENAKCSENGIGKQRFPVSAKPKAGRNVLPQPVLKTTVLMASRQKRMHCPSSSKFQSVISSQKKEEHVTSSPSKYVAPKFSKQPSEEVPSKNNHDLVTSESNILTRRASVRRKSFTSLLMTRPKQLKEQTGHTKQEFLPNIYDNSNHLDVSEYVDDIYQYYWVMEAQSHPLKSYMEFQTEITPQMRGILINWLIEVHLKFDLMQETLFLMVTILDQYLSRVCIKKNEMQLVGLTALLLASKYEDFWHPRIMDLISVSAESYTREQMLGMEKAILKKLLFRLNVPTPYVFMLRLLKASQANKKLEHLAFFLVELCLVEFEALNYKPSLLCASAIYVARCTLQMTPAWTPLLERHACYKEFQLRNCAEMILRFHKAARTTLLKVTCEKYMRFEYSKVAAIKPLEAFSQ